MGEVLAALSPQARREIVLEPERLSNIDDEIRLPVEQFVERVAEERGDHAAKVMTLRSGDLEAIAFESGLAPRTLLDRLAPALRR
jgi:hypothetical protein